MATLNVSAVLVSEKALLALVVYQETAASSQPPPRTLSQPGISQPGLPPAPTTPLNTQDCRLPPLATVLKTSIPTLKHVPKGARDRWARVLKDCISTICNSPDKLTPLTGQPYSCSPNVFLLALPLATASAGETS